VKKSLFISTFLILSSSLYALPVQKETVSGSASFSSSDPSHLQITASDKAIINYQTFNILENEHVEFVQPSSKSCILNRVVGKDPSKILGKLDGNGLDMWKILPLLEKVASGFWIRALSRSPARVQAQSLKRAIVLTIAPFLSM
jgi:hypothetical protein